MYSSQAIKLAVCLWPFVLTPPLSSYSSFGFLKTSSHTVQSTVDAPPSPELPMRRSAEQRSRRAAKERERRAVESPASRQARLASDKATVRDRRAAETPPSRRLGWLLTTERLQLGIGVLRKARKHLRLVRL